MTLQTAQYVPKFAINAKVVAILEDVSLKHAREIIVQIKKHYGVALNFPLSLYNYSEYRGFDYDHLKRERLNATKPSRYVIHNTEIQLLHNYQVIATARRTAAKIRQAYKLPTSGKLSLYHYCLYAGWNYHELKQLLIHNKIEHYAATKAQAINEQAAMPQPKKTLDTKHKNSA